MRRFILFTLFVAALFAGRADAQIEIKAAGGFLLDPVRWGGHLSVDIPVGDDYPTYLAPFVEVHRKSGYTAIPAGVSLLYKAPFTEEFGTAFFGIGTGLYRVSGPDVLIDLDDMGNVVFVTVDRSSTQAMITAGGGVHIHLTESVGTFVHARWFRAFASGSRNEVSLMAGLSFRFGED